MFFGGLAIVWVLGSVVADIYDSFVHRKECIEHDGWFKGFFWCSNEHIATIRNDLAWNSVKNLLFWPFRLGFWLTEKESDTGVKWGVVNNADAYIASSLNTSSKDGTSRVFFLIFYNQKRKCEPYLSLKNEYLSPLSNKKEETRETDQTIAFFNDKSKSVDFPVSFYGNEFGFEYVRDVYPKLLNDLSQVDNIFIKTSDRDEAFGFKMNGFQEANQMAEKNCLANLAK